MNCCNRRVPDFFSDDYLNKARAAFKHVDGMALSNLLAGRVFNALFREVFSGDLDDRSKELVEGVRGFMQKTLGTLCDRACPAHPVLLNELKANLVEEFIDARETETKTTVRNIIEAELGWVFTQDPSYEDTMRRVREMVNSVRKSKVAHDITAGTEKQSTLKGIKAVGNVPVNFISKTIDCTAMSEEDVTRGLQVGALGRTPINAIELCLFQCVRVCWGQAPDLSSSGVRNVMGRVTISAQKRRKPTQCGGPQVVRGVISCTCLVFMEPGRNRLSLWQLRCFPQGIAADFSRRMTIFRTLHPM